MGFDGGFVEILIDGGSFWEVVVIEKYFCGGNLCLLNYSIFVIFGIEVFSGMING